MSQAFRRFPLLPRIDKINHFIYGPIMHLPTPAIRTLVVLLSASFGSFSAMAQGVKVDPLTLYPTASLSYGKNDNVLLTNTPRTSSNTTVFAAGLRAELESGKSKYGVGYDGTFGRYESSTVDNYDYHTLSAFADMDLSTRARLKLGADHSVKSDPRGSLPTAVTPSPNKYRISGINGLFSYGAPGAQGRVELESAFTVKRYENNRVTTALLDVDTQKVGATLFWRVAPKTELLLQATGLRSNYTFTGSTLDNTTYVVVAGVKWEATALTEGTFKIGMTKKDMMHPGRKDTLSGAWEAGVIWKPLTYSIVNLTTGRALNDPLAGGNAIENSYYNAKWTHEWTDRITSTVAGSYATDQFRGTVPVERSDKTSSLGLGLAYAMQRWLTFGADYTYSMRDSNLTNFNYRKNLMMFTAKVAL